MPTPKMELSETLLFRPGHGGDPGPWLLQHLDKQQIVQIASIQIELQKAIQTAYGKALDGFAGVLEGGGR